MRNQEGGGPWKGRVRNKEGGGGGGRGGAHEGSRGGEEEEQGAERKEGRGRVRKFRREEQIEINEEQAWYLIRQGGGDPPRGTLKRQGGGECDGQFRPMRLGPCKRNKQQQPC